MKPIMCCFVSMFTFYPGFITSYLDILRIHKWQHNYFPGGDALIMSDVLIPGGRGLGVVVKAACKESRRSRAHPPL